MAACVLFHRGEYGETELDNSFADFIYPAENYDELHDMYFSEIYKRLPEGFYWLPESGSIAVEAEDMQKASKIYESSNFDFSKILEDAWEAFAEKADQISDNV